MKITGGDLKKSSYTKRQKALIIKKMFVNEISLDDAEKEFASLREAMCNADKIFSPYSRVGNNIVDYFTRPQRLDVEGNKGINFFDFLYNKSEFYKKDWFKRFISIHNDMDEVRAMYKAFQVYYGSVNIFRPLIAIEFYCMFKPKSILDFTMGWGGRLVGATALNIPKYIGIDMNQDLKAPYTKLVDFLKDKTTTDIKLYFTDALKVDYTKLDYDMVFTSPPYYNVEIYKGTKKQSKDDWDREFYEPIFRKTYAGLKKQGWYCLNVPVEVYERVCIRVLGRATKLVPFRKGKRGVKGGVETYSEMIYCWKKK